MARGWESKDVEAQQSEADRRRNRQSAPRLTADAERVAERRRGLELARARVVSDLAAATVPAHRLMLEQSLAALDLDLADQSRDRPV